MPYRYIVIKPDGTVDTTVRPKLPDWKEIQQHVEGPFQIVPYFSSLEHEGLKLQRGTAYANEEGYIRGMPHNPVATQAWIKACPKGDPKRMQLSGPILFIAKEKPVSNGKTSVR
jgi:hypothetical protein